MSELFVPVTEDLRQPDLRFDIVKGLELVSSMLHDKAKDASVTTPVAAGDWMVINASGLLAEPGASSDAMTVPVWVGDDSFDTKGSGKLTVIMGGDYVVQTKKYETGTYAVGTELTVKNSRKVRPAVAGDFVFAICTKAPGAEGVLEMQVLGGPAYKKA